MRFEHAPDTSYEDVGGGVVLHSAPGFPGFPARLALELFERARMMLGRHRVGLWDPLCGAGGLATTLALSNRARLTRVLATDVDAAAVALAARNLALTSAAGLAARRRELADRGAAPSRLAAADRLREDLRGALPTQTVRVDATDPGALAALDLEGIDVVFADLPYGSQTGWTASASDPGAATLTALRAVLPGDAVVVFVTIDRDQARSLPAATRSFKHGHRFIRLYRTGGAEH